jgi:hypothetical protein
MINSYLLGMVLFTTRYVMLESNHVCFYINVGWVYQSNQVIYKLILIKWYQRIDLPSRNLRK